MHRDIADLITYLGTNILSIVPSFKPLAAAFLKKIRSADCMQRGLNIVKI